MHHTSCQLAAAKEKVKGSCKQWQLAEWRFITWNPVSLLVGPSINKRVELTGTTHSSLSSPPSPLLSSLPPWIASAKQNSKLLPLPPPAGCLALHILSFQHFCKANNNRSWSWQSVITKTHTSNHIFLRS
jgi:hypothetical protein